MKIEILVSIGGEDSILVEDVSDDVAQAFRHLLPLSRYTPAEIAMIGIQRGLLDLISDIAKEIDEECSQGPLCGCAVCERNLKEYFHENRDRIPAG